MGFLEMLLVLWLSDELDEIKSSSRGGLRKAGKDIMRIHIGLLL